MNESVVGIERDVHSQGGQLSTDAPVVSVVIPAYNAAKYIAATLESVFAQTFRQYEIIVVNDGSPDTPDLERVLQPYAGKIRYTQKKNGGPSSARNLGIRLARGKYIAFLDSDDIWLPQHLANQVGILQRDPSLGLVYANGLHIEEDRPICIAFDRVSQSQPVTFDSLLREHCTVNTSSTVVLRKAVLEAGLFDEQIKRCEDVDLWLRLAHAGVRMTCTRDIQIGHRLANGLAANGELMKQGLIDVFKKIMSTLSLTPEQVSYVRRKIPQLAMSIQFEQAKKVVLDGNPREALQCIERAKGDSPGGKLLLFEIGVRYFPRLLQSSYRSHLRRVEKRKRRFQKRSLEAAGFADFKLNTAPDRPSLLSK